MSDTLKLDEGAKKPQKMSAGFDWGKHESFAMMYGHSLGKSVIAYSAQMLSEKIGEAKASMDAYTKVLEDKSWCSTYLFAPKPEKPWEARLPQDRSTEMKGFRRERRAADAKQRRRAKAARKQRRRCR
jgi:hypothetical protein